MEEVLALLGRFWSSPEGLGVKGLLVGSIAVFGVGTFAALRDGTFDASYLGSFVRTTVWGKVAPVLLFLFLGYAFSEPLLTGPAIVAAAAVAAEMLKSAWDSLQQARLTKEASAQANTPPTG